MNADFVKFLFDLLQGWVGEVSVHRVENCGRGKLASGKVAEASRETRAANDTVPLLCYIM